MRKLILQVAASLDGYIEGPNGEIDWCFTDQDYGMKEFLNRVDSLFMGRKTYELTVKMGGTGFPQLKNYVFSNSLRLPDENVTLVQGDIIPQVTSIKQQAGKDIWLYGGAALSGTLMRENLVDEILVALHPVILGGGKPLFENLRNRAALELVEAKTYDSGLVMLHHNVKQS